MINLLKNLHSALVEDFLNEYKKHVDKTKFNIMLSKPSVKMRSTGTNRTEWK